MYTTEAQNSQSNYYNDQDPSSKREYHENRQNGYGNQKSNYRQNGYSYEDDFHNNLVSESCDNFYHRQDSFYDEAKAFQENESYQPEEYSNNYGVPAYKERDHVAKNSKIYSGYRGETHEEEPFENNLFQEDVHKETNPSNGYLVDTQEEELFENFSSKSSGGTCQKGVLETKHLNGYCDNSASHSISSIHQEVRNLNITDLIGNKVTQESNCETLQDSKPKYNGNAPNNISEPENDAKSSSDGFEDFEFGMKTNTIPSPQKSAAEKKLSVPRLPKTNLARAQPTKVIPSSKVTHIAVAGKSSEYDELTLSVVQGS